MTPSLQTPAFVRTCLIWGILIPQCFLIASNIYGWLLVSGDAVEQEIINAAILFTCQIGLLIFFTVLWYLLQQQRIVASVSLTLVTLILQIAYLLTFLFFIGDIIPKATQAWILAEGNVGRWNFTLIMPGLFLSLYALTKGVFSNVPTTKTTGVSLAIIIAVPVLWYLLISLKQPMWFGQIGTVIGVIIGICFVLAFLAALIKLVDTIAHTAIYQKATAGHYIFAVIIGLVAPLCGLYLNRSIDFPCDFQVFDIYLLTVANALILMIKPGSQHFLPAIVFLRFAVLPFTAYIFFVFLPFLPLSLFAILLIGAGFLMLSPLVLGIFQSYISLEDLKSLKRAIGPLPASAIALAAFLLLPSYLTVQAFYDKRAIGHTLDYFYANDPTYPPLTKAQIKRSKNALQQLQDRKNSQQLPYISSAYNAIVFGQMVLSDEKISQTYRWLSNEKITENKGSLFGNDRGRRTTWRTRAQPPRRDVTLESADLFAQKGSSTSLRLTLKNNQAETHTLYSETLKIPEGVFVTGLRLKIEDEWVTGQIFDKKTALWVFEKITEVRRDPAIIYYKTANELELRVYPFPENGIREVELDFAFHPESNADISIGTQKIKLQPNKNNTTTYALNVSGEIIIDTSNTALSYKRKPYLHFILDYSQGSKRSPESYITDILHLSRKFNINTVTITAANLSTSKASPTLLNIDNHQALIDTINKLDLPEQGGFWCPKALAREIQRLPELKPSNITNQTNQSYLLHTPVFVMLHRSAISDCHYTSSYWQLPDIQYYYRYDGAKLSRIPITPKPIAQTNPEAELLITPSPIFAVAQGNAVQILQAHQSSITPLDGKLPVSIYNPKQKQFTQLESQHQLNTLPAANWLQTASLWLDWKNTLPNPAKLETTRDHFLDQSRALNILLPTTALIAVEQSSQWEILKRKEKQALNNSSVLDFEEAQDTPEPPEIIMLLLLLLTAIYTQRKIAAKKDNNTRFY